MGMKAVSHPGASALQLCRRAFTLIELLVVLEDMLAHLSQDVRCFAEV